jgi:hypothetical protein
MRFKLPLLALIVSASLNLGTAKAELSQRGVFYLPANLSAVEAQEAGFSFLPEFDLSFDSLDPRDSQNKSLASAAALQNLEEIFSSGLYAQLTLKKTYTNNDLASILLRRINACKVFFTKDIPCLLGNCIFTLGPLQRKADRVLCLIPGLLIFPLIIFSLIKFSKLQVQPTKNKAFLVLRC